jgi:ABC-type multidrug transport system fused ATPase/permease subunit
MIIQDIYNHLLINSYRSPVFASFSASLKGLPTIRAFSGQERFQADFLKQLSSNGDWYYAFLATGRWIGVRLDLMSATTLLSTTLLAMATHATVSPALLALALTYTLQLTGSMQWFVRQTAEVENCMTAVVREIREGAAIRKLCQLGLVFYAHVTLDDISISVNLPLIIP